MMSSAVSSPVVAQIVINAPPARVFQALSDAAQRVKWWGAKGKFQVTHMESDLRAGGGWLMSGVAGENKPFTVRGQYRAVDPPRLLEFTWNADWDASPTLVRFDLEESAGATTVRVTHSGFKDEAAKQYYQGWPWLLSLLRTHTEGTKP
jgi:uncharacterized protein YndB with AHSA1/START domain